MTSALPLRIVASVVIASLITWLWQTLGLAGAVVGVIVAILVIDELAEHAPWR